MSAVVQPGVVLADKFQVERLLGEGGMGVVVAAHHLELGQLVALKFMLPQALSFPQAAHRFMREGRVLERFQGEHTPRVVDKGVLENGAPYFAMEYVDGIDLGKLVRQYGALSVKDSVDFVLQACAGMAEAHEAHVVHRDLKPSNLILTQRPDGSTLIKVLDFGLSKILTEDEHEQEPSVSQTQTTGTMGTPAYMSPEQARSAKYVDARADIWSLGAILFHLASAGLPFPAQATAEAFAKLLYDDPVSLRAASPWVPAELEDIVMRCLQKEPEDRFQSVTELAQALRPFSSEGHIRRPATDSVSVIVDGPSDIDVPGVLQQRTTMSFDSMKLALSHAAHPELFVDLPGTTPPRRRRLNAWLAALAGMIAGAAIIAGVLLFLGKSHISAAEDSRVDRPVEAAPPGGEAAITEAGYDESASTTDDSQASARSSDVREGDAEDDDSSTDDPAAKSASGDDDQTLRKEGTPERPDDQTLRKEGTPERPDDEIKQGSERSSRRHQRHRRRGHRDRDADDVDATDSRSGRQEEKTPRTKIPEADPFGTIH